MILNKELKIDLINRLESVLNNLDNLQIPYDEDTPNNIYLISESIKKITDICDDIESINI